MKVPLEDGLMDVLGKAAAGMGMNATALARRTGLDEIRVQTVMDGKFESGIVMRLAEALNLHAPSLFQLATGAWYPEQGSTEGILQFNTPFPVPGYAEMTVNSYLVWDPHSKMAAAFDTGANVEEMLECIEVNKLRLVSIFLTHGHEDHIHALPKLVEATGHPKVYANEIEKIPGTEPFKPGQFFSIGYLQVETCLTSGHSPGGITYVIHGMDMPVAVVGDALFCCSQGGAAEHYEEAIENNKREIFSLPDETIVCPGHGPMSTIGDEREHNPFYAAGYATDS
jgi:glyoxylase-like metal-dependent hydrolase (beta-lactamase superfamily II)